MYANELSELILTKFCHDIAGVAGALMNGTELLSDSLDDKDFLKQASQTLADSSRFLTYRLRFFRAAFGTPKQNYSPTAGIQLTSDYISTLHDISVDWEDEGEEDFALTRIKLILSFVCVSALPKGGVIKIRQRTATVEGPNVFLPDNIDYALQGDESKAFDSEVAGALFLHNYLLQSGYTLNIQKQPDLIIFGIE